MVLMLSVLDWLSLWQHIISCVTIKLFNQDPAKLRSNECCVNSDLCGKLMGLVGRLELKLGN